MIALLTPLLYSLGPAALLLVMAVVFAESGLLVGFFLPGDSLLFLAGALVASHVIGLPIWALAAGVLVAAVVGDQVGYLIGRRFGPRLFSRPDSRFFSRANAERAEQFFAHHGPKAVILARFIPAVRTFVPATAGIGTMDRRRFTTYNVIGAAVWSIGIVAAGFYFGGIPFVAPHIELITIGLAGFSVIPALLAYAKQRRGRPATGSSRTADPIAKPRA
jgi:membrane-associated protein/undecaprenyl-diphosphatase